MRPYKILLVFISIFILLFFISLIFPENGIKINEKLWLQFPSFHEIISKNEIEYKDISHIISASSVAINDTLETTVEIMDEKLMGNSLPTTEIKMDSVSAPSFDIIRVKADSLKSLIFKMQFPDNDKNILYPFFDNLKDLRNNPKLIRILHYGDSQIEGDRITSFIRNKLQENFGGMGIGLFPAVLLNKHSISLKHSTSDNWKKYTIKDVYESTINHRHLGILISFSRFSAHPDELNKNNKIYESWINLKKSDISYPLARRYNQCRILYSYNTKPLIVELHQDNVILDAEILIPNKSLNILQWTFNTFPDEITIKFKGEDSPDVYAIALDDTVGIAMDNIPLRGSQGLEFTRTDMSLLQEMYNRLNVKLLLLQFGVNVVPNIVDDYIYYENQFYHQLKSLKEIQPDLTIIVMGVSDMSTKNKGIYESYPNIEKIRDAQKRAAFKAGCAFWDTYEAMGGNNSMPSWVFAKPSLAQKDFIHYSYRGAKVIAEMFYNSLITEYNEYLKKSWN